MSYGVPKGTPWNSDAYDTKNAKILLKISISLDPPTINANTIKMLGKAFLTYLYILRYCGVYK